LFFLNAYTSATEEDRTWHRLPTCEVRVEMMPVMSAFQSDRNLWNGLNVFAMEYVAGGLLSSM